MSVIGMMIASACLTQTQSLPWQIRLGQASHQVQQHVALVDQVVLVPDIATLADEIGRWTPTTQWPILIDDPATASDDALTSMFVRRFAPGVVYRRPSVGPWPRDRDARRQRIEAATRQAWDADAEVNVWQAARAAGVVAPPSLVVTSTNDPACAAAMVLSAGRAQELAWLDGDYGKGGGVLSGARSAQLVQRIEQAAASTGRRWQGLGDGIDALTICRMMAARARTGAPVPQADQSGEPVAITDLIGRFSNGTRWAATGWIFGSHQRSSWAAMCSLFMPHDVAWLCDTYPNKDFWAHWSLAEGAQILRDAGFEVALLQAATLGQIQTLAPDGLVTDLALMNSKGNNDYFEMGDGRTADAGDVPVLNTPAAVSLIHSWSLQIPSNIRTVGGRWLDHGAYAMVGSSHEPMLNAFVPPSLFVRRMLAGMPMLVAARWSARDETNMSLTWRVNTIGDPLMVVLPASDAGTPRAPAHTRARGWSDVKNDAVAAMTDVEDHPTDDGYARALRDLVLIGQDEIAAGLWDNAVSKGVEAHLSAEAAFGALFRRGRHDALVMAWNRLGTPTTLQADMLWRALGHRIGPSLSDDALDALRNAITGDSAATRWSRLAPEGTRRFGVGWTHAGVQASMQTASRRQRQALQSLLK